MAGVEPASEEKTIQTTTCVVSLSSLALPDPIDRICRAQPRSSPLSRGSHGHPGESHRASPPEVGALLEPGGRDSWGRAT